MIKKEIINNYYDENVIGKITDYLNHNPRVEKAWKTINKFTPSTHNSILEIGCSIGYIAHRMAKKFKKAEIYGLDISEGSINLANKYFLRKNIKYYAGELSGMKFNTKFDLIYLIDVYEHIALSDREGFNKKLADILNSNGRIILAFPNPDFLDFLRENNPKAIQPVDENITMGVLNNLALITKSHLIFYKKVSIWYKHDYIHAVFEKTIDPQENYNNTLFSSNSIFRKSIILLNKKLRSFIFLFSIKSIKLLKYKIVLIRKHGNSN